MPYGTTYTRTTVTTTRRRIHIAEVDFQDPSKEYASRRIPAMLPPSSPNPSSSGSASSTTSSPLPEKTSVDLERKPSSLRRHGHRKAASTSVVETRKNRLSWNDQVEVIHINKDESVLSGAEFWEPTRLAEAQDDGAETDVESDGDVPTLPNSIPFPKKRPSSIEQWAQAQLDSNRRNLRTNQRVRQRASSDAQFRPLSSERRGVFVRRSICDVISEEDRSTLAREEMNEDELLAILEEPEDPPMLRYRRNRTSSITSTMSTAVSFGAGLVVRTGSIVGGAALSIADRQLNTNKTVSGLHIRRKVRRSLLLCAEASAAFIGMIGDPR